MPKMIAPTKMRRCRRATQTRVSVLLNTFLLEALDKYAQSTGTCETIDFWLNVALEEWLHPKLNKESNVNSSKSS